MKAIVHEHFENIERQSDTARIGVWMFLASELMLFAGLFAYVSYVRSSNDPLWIHGVHDNTKTFGSINTGVLLASSWLVASATHAIRKGQIRACMIETALTMLLGVTFLVIKFVEYGEHIHEHFLPGSSPFWTAYWLMTGLHALHVTAGITILGILLFGIWRGWVNEVGAHRLELGATYWHLVDVVWIFLWPIFYLA